MKKFLSSITDDAEVTESNQSKSNVLSSETLSLNQDNAINPKYQAQPPKMPD